MRHEYDPNGPDPVNVDVQDAAKLLSISPSLVRKLDRCGKMPEAIRLGRRKLWLVEELIAWNGAGCPSRAAWNEIKRSQKR